MQNDKFIYPLVNVKATGENIKRIMHENGLKVNDIRDYLRLASSQSVYHWLSGISLPSLDNMYALSELFRVPIDSIIKGNRRYGSLIKSKNSSYLLYDRLLMYYKKINELKAG